LKHDRDFKDRVIKDMEKAKERDRKNYKDLLKKLHDREKDDGTKNFKLKKNEDREKMLQRELEKCHAEIENLKRKGGEKEMKLKDAVENMRRHIDDLNR
jgi:dsDNA-specific endonuclease/ATPase MutS2